MKWFFKEKPRKGLKYSFAFSQNNSVPLGPRYRILCIGRGIAGPSLLWREVWKMNTLKSGST